MTALGIQVPFGNNIVRRLVSTAKACDDVVYSNQMLVNIKKNGFRLYSWIIEAATVLLTKYYELTTRSIQFIREGSFRTVG
jgi:hypothetical protein